MAKCLRSRRLCVQCPHQGIAGTCGVERDRTEGYQSSRRGDVGVGPDTCVKPLTGHGRTGAHEQAQHSAQRNGTGGPGRHGCARQLRGLPHAHPHRRDSVRSRRLDLRDGIGEHLTDRRRDHLGTPGIAVGHDSPQQHRVRNGGGLDMSPQDLRREVESELCHHPGGDAVAGHEIDIGLHPLLGQQAALVGRCRTVAAVRRHHQGLRGGVDLGLPPGDGRGDQRTERDADDQKRPTPAERSDVVPKFHQQTCPLRAKHLSNHSTTLRDQHTRFASTYLPSVVVTPSSQAETEGCCLLRAPMVPGATRLSRPPRPEPPPT